MSQNNHGVCLIKGQILSISKSFGNGPAKQPTSHPSPSPRAEGSRAVAVLSESQASMEQEQMTVGSTEHSHPTPRSLTSIILKSYPMPAVISTSSHLS